MKVSERRGEEMAVNAMALDSDQTAGELCKDVDLGEEALALIEPQRNPRQFVHGLIERRLLFDAIRVVARALPKQLAVQWACACVGPAMEGRAEGSESDCLDAAARWAAEPSEENRKAAADLAEAAGYDTPSAWAAAAAGWSGGSLAPPDLPAVPPPDHLTAHAVSGAIGLAAAAVPEQVEERQIAFLQAGLDLADRTGSESREAAS